MISIVTTYKNRRHHLEKTFPTWLSQEHCEVIIVDYESDDDISFYLSQFDTNKTIKHVRCSHTPYFRLSHARNIGASHSTGDWLFFVDIDTCLTEGSIGNINKIIEDGCYLAAIDSQIRKLIINGGLMLISKKMHNSIYGFNERLIGWGYEDIDYKRRLESVGVHYKIIPSDLYECIDHPDEERTQEYSIDKEISWTRNRQIALQTWRDPSFGEWPYLIVGTYGEMKCAN